MRTILAVAAASIATLFTHAALAVDMPTSMTQAPSGAGTERPNAKPAEADRFVEGVEAAANIGSGFSDTYGIGFGVRVGYVMRNGIYAGGALSYYRGNSVGDNTAHGTFIGGELGYKFYPTPDKRWELRPFVFGGPAFVTTVDSIVNDKTSFAVQPGFLGAYHFGDVFLSAEARYLLTPTPTTMVIMAGGGVGF